MTIITAYRYTHGMRNANNELKDVLLNTCYFLLTGPGRGYSFIKVSSPSARTPFSKRQLSQVRRPSVGRSKSTIHVNDNGPWPGGRPDGAGDSECRP